MEKIDNILASCKLSESDRNSVRKVLLKLLSVRKDIENLSLALPDDSFDMNETVKLLDSAFMLICCCISNETWDNPDQLYSKIQKCLNERLHLIS